LSSNIRSIEPISIEDIGQPIAIDESPSSMFSFPSSFQDFRPMSMMRSRFPSFGGYAPPPQKPLYLMIRDVPMIGPQQLEQQPAMNMDAAFPSSIFTLRRSNQVGENTWRYSVNSNGDGHTFMTQSWSTPKSYHLCDNEECDEQNGMRMEMKNILDDFMNMNANGKPYMHLMPTSTMQPMELFDEQYDVDYDGYDVASWRDDLMQKMKGCGHKMQSWIFGGDQAMDGDDESSEEVMVKPIDETVDYQYGSMDLPIMMVGMSIFFSFIMLCVVVCSGWKYVFAKKKMEKRIMATSEGYVTLQETDSFQ